MLIFYTVAVMDNCYRSSFLPEIKPQKVCLNSTAWKSIWTDGRDPHKCLLSYTSSKDALFSHFRRDQKSLMPRSALLGSYIQAAGSCWGSSIILGMQANIFLCDSIINSTAFMTSFGISSIGCVTCSGVVL